MTIKAENPFDEENPQPLSKEDTEKTDKPDKEMKKPVDEEDDEEPDIVVEPASDVETGGAAAESEAGEGSPDSGTGEEEPPKFPFSQAFFDPISNKIMIDPVVLEDGLSYEKQDVIERDETTVYYPNRALKTYIESEIARYGDAGTVRAAVQQWSESLRSGWNRLLETTPLSAGEYRPLPDSFYCPITFELIHEPQIDPDGHTYEKAAILQWIRTNNDSPVTRKPLTSGQLRENKALLNVLLYLAEETEEVPASAIHPSIRRWKEEHDTRPPTPDLDPNDETAEGMPASSMPSAHNHHQQQTSYPSTREELEALQRLRRQKHATMLGIMVICLLIFFFAPSYFMCFLMVLVAASIIYAPQMARHRQLEERRREIIAEAYRREAQRRQQQQQQEQQQQGEP